MIKAEAAHLTCFSVPLLIVVVCVVANEDSHTDKIPPTDTVKAISKTTAIIGEMALDIINYCLYNICVIWFKFFSKQKFKYMETVVTVNLRKQLVKESACQDNHIRRICNC
jgi:hypothetical protein